MNKQWSCRWFVTPWRSCDITVMTHCITARLIHYILRNMHMFRALLRFGTGCFAHMHYNDVIMGATSSQITSLTIVFSAVYSGADQRKHENSAALAFVRGIHRWSPVNSPHKWPVTRKMVPFDDVIMLWFGTGCFAHIPQRYLTGTGAIVRLRPRQLSNRVLFY